MHRMSTWDLSVQDDLGGMEDDLGLMGDDQGPMEDDLELIGDDLGAMEDNLGLIEMTWII